MIDLRDGTPVLKDCSELLVPDHALDALDRVFQVDGSLQEVALLHKDAADVCEADALLAVILVKSIVDVVGLGVAQDRLG